MRTEKVSPNICNFITSLRDLGYTYEIAVADILDNSISAGASEVKIHTVPNPEKIFCLLDNGIGLSDSELKEAMRLATKNPNNERSKKDLGRYGLGLKTASFSQCKKLTVVSKKNKQLSIRQWDLDYLSKQDDWYLIIPELSEVENFPLFKELEMYNHGTLVVWQDIDRYKDAEYSRKINDLRKHLSLVFHRFLEGADSFTRLKISINDNILKPFNPFNANHAATNEKTAEKIKIYESPIEITPYILPHHSKTSQQEWDANATIDGYIKSQGFYLYRANRLLIHGTWWGLHKATDAHKLVRIKIDISNDQDKYWGIDIKKSVAHPIPELRKDLKRIISEVTKEGIRPFTKRGRRLKDKSVTKVWELIPVNGEIHFGLNKDHPLYQKLFTITSKSNQYWLATYLKSIVAYLPLESIQAQLQQNPHIVKQKVALSENEIIELSRKLKEAGLDKVYIEELIKTEMFENKKELISNEQL
jgi:hypothetical protein